MLDIYLGLFYQPFIFLPAIRICEQGILSRINFPVILFVSKNWIVFILFADYPNDFYGRNGDEHFREDRRKVRLINKKDNFFVN
jgi:hypothetical protein